jgi:hypothetical protein
MSTERMSRYLNLVELKIPNGYITRHVSFAELIDEELGRLTCLTSLDINLYNSITDRCIMRLVNLRSLKMQYNITISNAALSKLSNLTSLDLTYDLIIEKTTKLPTLAFLD